MEVFEYETIDEAYPELIKAVLDEGQENSPRGQLTWDLGPTTLIILDPSQKLITNKKRKISPYLCFAEFLWIITQQNRVEMVGFYNKRMYDFSDDGITLYGAYGPRLMRQIPAVIDKIKLDHNTRQAVATILRPNDTISKTKDFPCNILLHFVPRKGKLNLITYVRSQDIFLGLPYDFYHWATLLQMVAAEVDMPVGTFTHICGSLHAYQRNKEVLETIADSVPGDCIQIEESRPLGLLKSPRSVSTIEYKIRKNQINQEGFSRALDDIESLHEDDYFKDILKVLLYYRVRRSEGFMIDEILGMPYLDFIKHVEWN